MFEPEPTIVKVAFGQYRKIFGIDRISVSSPFSGARSPAYTMPCLSILFKGRGLQGTQAGVALTSLRLFWANSFTIASEMHQVQSDSFAAIFSRRWYRWFKIGFLKREGEKSTDQKTEV
jgi:hypothetical protein